MKILSRSFYAEILALQGFPAGLRDSYFIRDNTDKAIHEDEDITSKSEYIYTAPQRILVRDTDEGGRKQALIRDLTALVEAYQTGVIPQGVAQEL